jgi:murein L,D-transpeptidase YafK
MKKFTTSAFVLAAGVLMAACGQIDVPPHLRPLSKDTQMLLGKKQMKTNAPIFVRIFKEESELEVWKQRDDGHFYHFKTYPICNWSGDVGPKVVQGDKQAPEGFYTVARHQMNPNSQFHLAFNIGYPNAFDRAHKRTGDALMVHGKCKSAGCYAMTDAFVEEIYALAREAFIGGQDGFHVHAFPFRMTDANLARHVNHPALKFWSTLKDGYDHFEVTRQVPAVAVCERRYVVNPKWRNGVVPAKLEAEQSCPAHEKFVPEAFKPAPAEQVADAERIIVPGPKTRTFAANPGSAPSSSAIAADVKASPAPAFGLGFTPAPGSKQAATPLLGLTPQ